MKNQVEAIRQFNRFYTHRLGLLNNTFLGSRLSLTQSRVLLEIKYNPGCRANDLCAELGIDRGYLSRILRGFEVNGLIDREPDQNDRRARCLWLTGQGKSLMAELEKRSSDQVAQWLKKLAPQQRRWLVESMKVIQTLLEEKPGKPNARVSA